MAKLPEVHPAVHDAFMEGVCVVQRGDKKRYCGSSRYGSSYTYHKTSAYQYFWRVHTYAAETFSAVDRIWNRKNMQLYSNPSHFANQMLGPQHCEVLPFFHAFTGCDVVSSMLGIGKKTAWNAWNAYPKVTNTFVAIIQDPISIILDSLHMRRLERWTVLMYSTNCDAELLNDAMKVMFTHSLMYILQPSMLYSTILNVPS